LIDWDPKAQKFITVGTKFPNGTTAKVKSVVTFPADLFDTVKWHDGSPLSVADFIMPIIMTFDRSYEGSPIYDEASVPYFKSFQSSFKGFKITSTNPLTIESYSDLYNSDAELDVTTDWPTSPLGLSGENSWDVLAISNMAEAAGELAYTADKADAKKIEQMSWIGGPSMDILSKHLDEAIAAGTVPYAPTLSQYLTADQAKARYNNLKAWYGVHKHFWLGTGPYYVDKAFLTEKTITLKNNGWFTDASDRWAKFATPKLASVQLDGPSNVKIGDTATFKVTVTSKGSPYLNSDIKQVKYLLYDATGAVIATGDAKAGTGDGNYEIVLGPDVTSKLVAGSDKIEVAVVPIPVAIPAFTSVDFKVGP
jgi:peptide/nickel transport system substrate-binding protein